MRNTGSTLGVLIVMTLLLCALFAPMLARFDPTAMGAGPSLIPPTAAHPFGTDEFGRDLFSRILYGIRLTLKVGVIAVGIACVAGTMIGLVSGYFGGRLDSALMRVVDVLFSFPDTLVALSIVAILGASLTNAMIAVGISAIPFYARLARGAALGEGAKQYPESARAVGAGHARILFRHLFPNCLPPIIVVTTLGFSSAVLSAAGLSFLGLGAQPPSPEWGLQLASSRNYLQRAPWLTIFPGLAIAITVLGFNLLGDGLRDILDPRQRGLR
jgi:peptide/nickel transport system permease protein